MNKLGCIMLDLIPFSPSEVVHAMSVLSEDLYTQKEPSRFWINGLTMARNPHMTLIFGLMKSGEEYKEQIAKLFKDWYLPDQAVQVESIGHFPSPFEDEPYYCIVAHIKVTDAILEAHQRLQMLPHIDTYSEFKPHVTLAYIRKDDETLKKAEALFNEMFAGKSLATKVILNLGDIKE